MEQQIKHIYRLEGHTPVPCSDLSAFAQLISDVEKRRVALSEIEGHKISTVFLGQDQRLGRSDEPELFETMVTDAEGEVKAVSRCATWEQAEAQHADAVASLQGKVGE